MYLWRNRASEHLLCGYAEAFFILFFLLCSLSGAAGAPPGLLFLLTKKKDRELTLKP
jgi:hypothetical protein